MASPPKIKSIFFAEFHPQTGPKISYQIPENFVTKEYFECIHTYIITKQELQDNIITVTGGEFKIIGCPVFIADQKYERNALIFNMCFVFDQNAETLCYEPIVKKLAGYLIQLETIGNYISQREKRENIPTYLENILTDLNSKGTCRTNLGGAMTVHLKVSPSIVFPPSVNDYDVPILLQRVTNSNWDLTSQQILPYINGFNHVGRIASEADVEINLVKSCLQNLLHYEVIKLISVFQYSNVYTTNDEIKKLISDKSLQNQCMQFVRKGGKDSCRPLMRDIFVLYCSLSAGTTVKDLCARFNIQGLLIDERKLIQFGLMKGLIRRLHRYPVRLRSSAATGRGHSLMKWFDGEHHYDDICSKTGYSYQDLDKVVDADSNIVVCWK